VRAFIGKAHCNRPPNSALARASRHDRNFVFKSHDTNSRLLICCRAGMLFGVRRVAKRLRATSARAFNMKLEEETTQFGEDQPTDAPSVVVGDATSVELPRWLRYLAEPRHAVPILLIVGVALYLVNLGGYPFYTKGEPREAVTVFAIVHGGGVILPQRAGIEIPSKPLLMHWLAALVSLIAGSVDEFSVRLPSAAFAIAGVIVCYNYVRRLFDEVIALIAALILATTFSVSASRDGRAGRHDADLLYWRSRSSNLLRWRKG